MMMEFNFDRYTERRNTGSLKYDFAEARNRPPDVLPLWVADMDFPTAPCVQEALTAAVDHGIFGYSEPLQGYFDAVIGWFERRFGYRPQPEWLVRTPGVVYALSAAVRSMTARGDSVLILTPVYYPFYEVIQDNGRKLVESSLRYENGAYSIDFEEIESKIKQNHVRMLLFCSPHNPVGRVWTREELDRLCLICETYDIIVVSDEIHCDFVWPGRTHIVLPTVSPAMSRRTVLCTAPSKTFNLAGLQISNIFIENSVLREKFKAEIAQTGYSQSGSLGLVACEAAYRDGEPWLNALNAYLWDNFGYLRQRLERIPGMELVEPEGTYLAWVDCTGLGLRADALEALILHKAKLWLDSGSLFGTRSAGFQRINLACPRSTLALALNQLESACRSIP